MKTGYYQSNDVFYCYPAKNPNDPEAECDWIVQSGNIPTRLSVADFKTKYTYMGETEAEVEELQVQESGLLPTNS